MNQRRSFLKLASGAAIPAAVATLHSGVARGADTDAKEFVGAWNTTHTLGFPPGFFREYLTFAEGGILYETNSFLHTASNLDFSGFGLPNVVNGSDGAGSWERVAKGRVRVVFRKLLFDGSRSNFGDLRVTGELVSDGARLRADWQIYVVDPFDKVLINFGKETSEGVRIS